MCFLSCKLFDTIMCLINAMALFQIRFVTMLSHSEGF